MGRSLARARVLALLLALFAGPSACSERESGPRTGGDGGGDDAADAAPTDGRADGTLDGGLDADAGPVNECGAGETRACYGGTPAHRGVGPCREGLERCEVSDAGAFVWSVCLGWVPAVSETCGNDVDDDCDGVTDEEPDGGPCTRRNPDCWVSGTEICTVGSCGAPGYVACWDGGCLDPPGGNCCTYHYTTRDPSLDGGGASSARNYCD